MLKFKIDQNDLSIVDGGCVDECTKTLVTPVIRLDYNSNVADARKVSEIVLHLHSRRDKDLFDRANYVMSGTMIDVSHTKPNSVLNVSFGGLRGEFKLTTEQLESINTNINVESVYLYFL